MLQHILLCKRSRLVDIEDLLLSRKKLTPHGDNMLQLVEVRHTDHVKFLPHAWASICFSPLLQLPAQPFHLSVVNCSCQLCCVPSDKSQWHGRQKRLLWLRCPEKEKNLQQTSTMSEFPCSHFIYMYTTHLAVPYLPIRFNRGRLISCSRAPGSWATYVIHAVSVVPIRAGLVYRNMQNT